LNVLLAPNEYINHLFLPFWTRMYTDYQDQVKRK